MSPATLQTEPSPVPTPPPHTHILEWYICYTINEPALIGWCHQGIIALPKQKMSNVINFLSSGCLFSLKDSSISGAQYGSLLLTGWTLGTSRSSTKFGKREPMLWSLSQVFVGQGQLSVTRTAPLISPPHEHWGGQEQRLADTHCSLHCLSFRWMTSVRRWCVI